MVEEMAGKSESSRRNFLLAVAGAVSGIFVPLGCPSGKDRRGRAAEPGANPFVGWETDDGGRVIPGGVAGKPRRVVVIGAGLAGLAAANALASSGVEVVVVEARDHIGGRTHTANLGGAPVDLGAMWIHNPEGNPLTELAWRVGASRRSFDVEGLVAGAGLVDGRGHRLEGAARREVLGLVANFTQRAEDLISASGPETPLAELIDTYVEEDTDPSRAAWTSFVLRVAFEFLSGAPVEDVPAAMMLISVPYGGGDDVPVGGYRPLIEALGEGLPIRTSTVVRAVRARKDGVEVETTDGRVERGSHAVVTLPLGVLKGGAVSFSPELPPGKARAISTLGFGDFEKVVLRYDERFWDERFWLWGCPNTGFLLRGTDVFPAWIDATGPAGAPTLVAVAAGSAGRAFGSMDEAAALERARGLLSDITGKPPPPERESTVTHWRADPFSRGAYTHLTLGSSTRDIEALAEPIRGSVLFAGEATSPMRFANADGAFTTGIREAKRLLGSGSVRLRLRRQST